MSRASDKCQPFFQILKKSFLMGCTLRRSIRNAKKLFELPPPPPPILVSPFEGELLTMYLAVSDFSTSTVLIRDKDRVQHPVYYYSRALRGAEERYPKMEKLIVTPDGSRSDPIGGSERKSGARYYLYCTIYWDSY